MDGGSQRAEVFKARDVEFVFTPESAVTKAIEMSRQGHSIPINALLGRRDFKKAISI
jgi:hypothetical protein